VSEELIFASEEEAVQHLADLTGKEIKIAAENDKQYVEIIFLQQQDSFDDFTDQETKETGVDAFFNASEDEMMDYLMQWEHGDNGETRKEKPWGSSDSHFEKKFGDDVYIMSYNSGLGYAGLVRVENAEE